MFLSLLSSVFTWAGCMLTAATQFHERQEDLEEENKTRGWQGERRKWQGCTKDVGCFYFLSPIHRKDMVKQLSIKGVGE